MKHSILITILILSTLLTKAQKIKTQKYDTVKTGTIVTIQMDTTSYKYLLNFFSRFPVTDKEAGYFYKVLDGENKNVSIEPVYELKPKTKK